MLLGVVRLNIYMCTASFSSSLSPLPLVRDSFKQANTDLEDLVTCGDVIGRQKRDRHMGSDKESQKPLLVMRIQRHVGRSICKAASLPMQ